MNMNTDTTQGGTQFATPEPKQEQAPSQAWLPQPASHGAAAASAEPFGGVIYAYTRAQAMEDGYLVAVGDMAREAGFRCPVAITRAAWEDCVAWSDEDTARKHWPQDQTGRLWDVLMMARFACRSAAGASLIRFEVIRVPRPGCGRRRRVALTAQIGPGDDGEAVITIGQPNDF